MVVWRGRGLGKVVGLTAVEGEAVGEEVETDEECEDFGGYLWAVFCRDG